MNPSPSATRPPPRPSGSAPDSPSRSRSTSRSAAQRASFATSAPPCTAATASRLSRTRPPRPPSNPSSNPRSPDCSSNRSSPSPASTPRRPSPNACASSPTSPETCAASSPFLSRSAAARQSDFVSQVVSSYAGAQSGRAPALFSNSQLAARRAISLAAIALFYMPETAVLLIDCPDRRGLVARVSSLLYEHGANILHADQHRDEDLGLFFMRVESSFAPIAAELEMRWTLTASHQSRVALFCSHYLHCMSDLLYRWRSGDLPCDIALIISNHTEVEDLASFHNVPFVHTPVTAGTRAEAEARQLHLLAEHNIELVVLARYMQVLSPAFVARYPSRIINVHHSFLPAFTGGRPYHAAHSRGVKLIGATSHYVTEVLDDGPIIEQDVARISHRDQVDDLVSRGRDLERIVLSRAVKWHLERRILCYGNKTVVFD